MAAAMAATISGRRPSLTFGMYSISIRRPILALYFRRSPCYDRGAVTALMSDPLRTDGSRAHADVASGSDRDAKIEQLLLVGLDHYFAARYELAINVWTRALFFDRNHARARAYIERARSALAERQRESEELLQTGVAAFQRGDGDEARRLLHAAIDRGAPSDEAHAVLDRLDRLEHVAVPAAPPRVGRAARVRVPRPPVGSRRPVRAIAITFVLAALMAAGAFAIRAFEPSTWTSI